MVCELIKIPDGHAFICSRGKRTPKCFYCGNPAGLECDYPVDKSVKKSGICDKKICSNCSINVGDNLDHCKAHSQKIVGTITIGNYKLGDKGIYIGRAMPTYNLKQSPLANQWKLGSLASNEQILIEYRKWLWKEIKLRGAVWQELQRITKLLTAGQNVKLICWCKDALGRGDCHGDIVKKAIEWMIKEMGL